MGELPPVANDDQDALYRFPLTNFRRAARRRISMAVLTKLLRHRLTQKIALAVVLAVVTVLQKEISRRR